jgi:hypothetical protein
MVAMGSSTKLSLEALRARAARLERRLWQLSQNLSLNEALSLSHDLGVLRWTIRDLEENRA